MGACQMYITTAAAAAAATITTTATAAAATTTGVLSPTGVTRSQFDLLSALAVSGHHQSLAASMQKMR